MFCIQNEFGAMIVKIHVFRYVSLIFVHKINFCICQNGDDIITVMVVMIFFITTISGDGTITILIHIRLANGDSLPDW